MAKPIFFKKESYMSRFKAGRLKDTEQLVICKLRDNTGDRPAIHVFTDGSSKVNTIIKVKQVAAVLETDDVPKVVKAKYDNYIYVTGSGGKPYFFKANNRNERDEWCNLLRSLLSSRGATGAQGCTEAPLLPPHRGRTQTDASSDKPPVRRRRANFPASAPGSMQDIFRDELNKSIKDRVPRHDPIPEGDENQVCCGRHHLEIGATHDAHCGEQDPTLYQNVHSVRDMDNWRKEQSSRMALRKTNELYKDLHHTVRLQEQPEDFYETPELNRRDLVPEMLKSFSGCSMASEESEGGASSVLSAAQSLRSRREPTESSWPSSPASSGEEEEQEYPQPAARPLLELPKRTLPELPARGRLPEPEASMCLEEQPQDIYMNTPLFPRTRTDSNAPRPRAASLRTERKPQLPPRKTSLSTATRGPVPPKLPEKNPASRLELLCRKLKEEKLSEAATVSISKTILVKNLPGLSLEKIIDCIIVTKLPEDLKDYFRVGDQWLKVNDSYLNGVNFAKDCVEMSDKAKIEITLKRVPFGTVCDFPWASNNTEDIGIKLTGNEIERVYPSGLAHRRGSLQSNDTNCLTSAGRKCNYVITELNFEPVDPYVTDEELWEKIKRAGRYIVLILHPVDFRTIQRGYTPDDDCIYENI